MRKTAIAVVAGIVIVLGLVAFLPLKPGEIPPIIQDQPKMEDQAQSNIVTTIMDAPKLADSAVSSNQIGYDFYVDEKGVKHYIVNAVDTPDIEG